MRKQQVLFRKEADIFKKLLFPFGCLNLKKLHFLHMSKTSQQNCTISVQQKCLGCLLNTIQKSTKGPSLDDYNLNSLIKRIQL